ncbi:MAG: hypothetical protein JWN61_571 [Pseudonocardiales bacterium]|nr:hypothetical protein [Pseudonocardiales bacterium]
MTPDGNDLLGIYLRDHYAGASGGSSLAHRIADAHATGPESDGLARLASDVDEDRDLLLAILDSLGIEPSRVMDAAAETGERLARLKPNGRVLRRSPLSDVVEYEAMKLGVAGKLSCWRTLRMLATDEPRLSAAALDGLIVRAESQLELLEAHRASAAARAFA